MPETIDNHSLAVANNGWSIAEIVVIIVCFIPVVMTIFLIVIPYLYDSIFRRKRKQ
jgi:hypothetical protein